MDFVRDTILGDILGRAFQVEEFRQHDEHDASITTSYIDRKTSANLARWGSFSSRYDIPYIDGTSSFDFVPKVNVASGARVNEKKGKDIYLVSFKRDDPKVIKLPHASDLVSDCPSESEKLVWVEESIGRYHALLLHHLCLHWSCAVVIQYQTGGLYVFCGRSCMSTW